MEKSSGKLNEAITIIVMQNCVGTGIDINNYIKYIVLRILNIRTLIYLTLKYRTLNQTRTPFWRWRR